MRKVNDEAVFWSRVTEQPSGCWAWLGTIERGGYGMFRLSGVSVRAHRYAYELLIADIPDGLVIDHLCRNRACVNPWHMDPVTNEVNVMRGRSFAVQNAEATHCPEGHAYAGENLTVTARGWRQCRSCRNAASRAYYRANADRLRAASRERQRRYSQQQHVD